VCIHNKTIAVLFSKALIAWRQWLSFVYNQNISSNEFL